MIYDNTETRILEQVYLQPGIHMRALSKQLKLSMPSISNGLKNIKTLLIELENIGSEKEKNDFVKNYARIKEEIKIVDQILNNDDMVENDNFESKTINELFELMELEENKIFHSEKLTAKKLKSLLVLSNILEKKINEDTMSIIENK